MKTVPAPLRAVLDADALHLSLLLEIVRQDAVVFRFTDHDRPLEFAGDTYVPGLVPDRAEGKNSLSPQNTGMRLLIDDTAILRSDLEAGRFDGATMRTWAVDPRDTALGAVMLARGTAGRAEIRDAGASLEVRGLSDRLRQPVVEVFTPGCPYDLGDARCTVALGPFTTAGTVTAVVSARRFESAALAGQADGFFDFGELTWTGGENVGLRNQVKRFLQLNGDVEVELPLPFAMQPGDAFSVVAGCDKQFATCQTKFSNTLFFGGFPHLPGRDKILKTGGQ